MEIFLRLRHWVIFMLTFGLLLLAFISLMAFNVLSLFTDVEMPIDYALRGILIAQTICFVIGNFWMFAIGTRLHQKYYYDSFLLLIFRWCIYFSTLAYSARYMIFPALDFFDGSINRFATLFAVGSAIYCSYFAARLLNSVEQQRDVAFREFAGDFFAFIFYPIGVWWLQPRINKVFGRDSEVYDPDAPLDQRVTN